MFCKNCGEKLADDALFCEKCGQAVSSAKKSYSSKLKPWYGFFLLGSVFTAISIVKFVRQYILENGVYQILAEELKDYPEFMDSFGTPLSYAWSATVKSPFPYLAGISFAIGVVWWLKKKQK